MRYRLRGYRTASGKCPVRDFLEEQRERRPELFGLLVAGIRKLRDRRWHRQPLTKSLSPSKLFEVRAGQGRILFGYGPNQMIVLLLGVVKKQDQLPRRVIEQAEVYFHDYEDRCADEDDGSDESFYDD